jgi:hypothetical protein
MISKVEIRIGKCISKSVKNIDDSILCPESLKTRLEWFDSHRPS